MGVLSFCHPYQQGACLETKGHISLDLITLEANPASGRYLIDIDGSLSINHLQRLPGKRLAMEFRDSTIEISNKDIDVVGRIVMTMEKE